MKRDSGQSADVTDGVVFSGELRTGQYSIIGNPVEPNSVCKLGSNPTIGRFCIVEAGVTIGDDFEMDDYCAVYSGAIIGSGVKLLYGKKIYSNALVGDECILGGNIPERCVLGDRVTFMGEVAHSHHDPTRDWNSTDEPSPEVGAGTIVGVNALIIGGIRIGHNCYISAGEVLRHDLEPGHVYFKGDIHKIEEFRGLIKTRY
jgi:acetyltransferase-like isoleucine patch superfamily enzyme